MIKKLVKYGKILMALTLIGALSIPSYATVGASDGSAFVTKAEFDAALSDFNARLTTFEAGINSKIDSQVSSYLDRNGIWNGKEQTLKWKGWGHNTTPSGGVDLGNLQEQMKSATSMGTYNWVGKNDLLVEVNKSGLVCLEMNATGTLVTSSYDNYISSSWDTAGWGWGGGSYVFYIFKDSSTGLCVASWKITELMKKFCGKPIGSAEFYCTSLCLVPMGTMMQWFCAKGDKFWASMQITAKQWSDYTNIGNNANNTGAWQCEFSSCKIY